MARSTHHQEYQVFLGLLRDLRVDAGITQIVLAKKLGNTQTFISKIERGERRIDMVEFVELCEALGVEPTAALVEFLSRCRGQRSPSGKLVRRPGKK